MSDINPANEDRVGNDYREGPNPNPGGAVDLGDRAVPPYEGRTESTADSPHKGGDSEIGGARVGGAVGPVEDDAMKAASPGETPGGTTASPADEQPASEQDHTWDSDPGVGPSHWAGTQRGEDVLDTEGTEAGREHTGTDGSNAQRPTGESSDRDQTVIDPNDGNTDRTAG